MADSRAAIHINGERVAMTVLLERWERPGATGSDADWIAAFAELTAGNFSGRRAVSLRRDELVGFRDRLADVLASLSGEATLEHIEGALGVRVLLNQGRGQLSLYLREELGPCLSVDDTWTDQSYLADTLRELDAALTEFGPRGA
ncbi:hypothetical protein CQY20_12110 [Mycolicibacterium agri]|uniref:Uncharacterized protein n=1 Tax=Mycolicibacterium agri TaxID=36811 RepID=A0A2A7N4H3_MYCAG|nr:hypothetical protein [Mycolicibacterium agri]PEG38709.1 hypothetical protein CQY20_12110 [Mycolicibacterium agri]GFG53445.1 hypothetical protein MAGR_48860 [Mycolicibacterium agri]